MRILDDRVTDIKPETIKFERFFDAVITDRILWLCRWFEDGKGALVRYEDGYEKDGRLGTNCRITRSLRTPMLFQAEVYAMDVYALENLKKSLKGARIYIVSDSRATLGALNGFSFVSKLVPGRFNVTPWPLATGYNSCGCPGTRASEETRRPFGSFLDQEGSELWFVSLKFYIEESLRTWEDHNISPV